MSDILITIAGVGLCTGPLWGGALGYFLARRGWQLRSPFHLANDNEEGPDV